MANTPEPDWLDCEPGFPEAMSELGRVFGRARRRWLVTLLVAAAATLLLVAKLARKPQVYRARAIMRMVEGRFSDTQRFLMPGQLSGYLWNVVFATNSVYPILEDLGLYPEEREIGQNVAIAAFREDIEVSVYRNYFLQSGSEGARSVRIAISYSSLDAAKTVEVVERMGQVLVEFERRRQLRGSKAMEDRALLALRDADEEVAAIEERRAELLSGTTAANEGGSVHGRALEAERLQQQIAGYQIVRTDARRDLMAARISRASPISVTLAELRVPQIVEPEVRKRRLILVGGFGFLFAVPLCAIFVGAFDSKVRRSEDIERLGLPVVGEVRGYTGDATGALRDRLPPKRWWQRGRHYRRRTRVSGHGRGS